MNDRFTLDETALTAVLTAVEAHQAPAFVDADTATAATAALDALDALARVDVKYLPDLVAMDKINLEPHELDTLARFAWNVGALGGPARPEIVATEDHGDGNRYYPMARLSDRSGIRLTADTMDPSRMGEYGARGVRFVVSVLREIAIELNRAFDLFAEHVAEAVAASARPQIAPGDPVTVIYNAGGRGTGLARTTASAVEYRLDRPGVAQVTVAGLPEDAVTPYSLVRTYDGTDGSSVQPVAVDPAWTVVGAYVENELLVAGVLRGDHQVQGGDEREDFQPWATSVRAPDAGAAESLAYAEAVADEVESGASFAA